MNSQGANLSPGKAGLLQRRDEGGAQLWRHECEHLCWKTCPRRRCSAACLFSCRSPLPGPMASDPPTGLPCCVALCASVWCLTEGHISVRWLWDEAHTQVSGRGVQHIPHRDMGKDTLPPSRPVPPHRPPPDGPNHVGPFLTMARSTVCLHTHTATHSLTHTVHTHTHSCTHRALLSAGVRVTTKARGPHCGSFTPRASQSGMCPGTCSGGSEVTPGRWEDESWVCPGTLRADCGFCPSCRVVLPDVS